MALLRAYDLLVDADCALPGAPAAAASVEPPALEVRQRAPTGTAGGRWLGRYHLAGRTLAFRVPGVATFACEDGLTIAVSPEPRAGPEDVGAFLVATALPMAIWMRGEIVLHAAAAVPPGGAAAVAIGGASGSGKSTVLRALIARGVGVLADDTVRLVLEGRAPTVSGLPAGYFLAEPGAPPGRARALHAVPPDLQVRRAALGALVMLAPTECDASRLSRLPVEAAFETLLCSRHRPLVPRLLGQERALFAPFLDLACSLPVFRWERPRNGAEPDDAEIAALLAAAGASGDLR